MNMRIILEYKRLGIIQRSTGIKHNTQPNEILNGLVLEEEMVLMAVVIAAKSLFAFLSKRSRGLSGVPSSQTLIVAVKMAQWAQHDMIEGTGHHGAKRRLFGSTHQMYGMTACDILISITQTWSRRRPRCCLRDGG
jgi:hypothetical protein